MKKFFLISILFVSFGSNAQTDLSLSEAIEKSLVSNYQIKLVKANMDVAETQNTWGMAGAIPSVNLNINNSNNLNDNTNNPATFFPGVVLVDNVSTSLDIAWTVFSGFGIRISKERFDQLEEQTKGNAIIAIEQTIYDVIIAYYTAVTQERKLEILEEMLAFSKSKYDYFKMKSEMGLQPSIEVLEFRNHRQMIVVKTRATGTTTRECVLNFAEELMTLADGSRQTVVVGMNRSMMSTGNVELVIRFDDPRRDGVSTLGPPPPGRRAGIRRVRPGRIRRATSSLGVRDRPALIPLRPQHAQPLLRRRNRCSRAS
jgi:hypothetical protein